MSSSLAVDLKGTGFPDVVWDGTKDREALKALRDFVVAQAEEACVWYLQRRSWKRFWGRMLRLAALAATSVAGIIPTLSQIFMHDGQPWVQPAWASVALAVAAGVVALDYFFGFSTGWMRFMETQQKIVHVLREFEFDWEALRTSWGQNNPTPPQLAAALTRLKQVALQVQQLVEDETNAWIAEFRSSLRLIDDAARAKLEAPTRAGVNVNVTNGEQAAGDWTLTVDEGTPTAHRGGRAALVGLSAGAHKLRVQGTIGKDAKHDETIAVVPATGVVEVSLTLK